MRHLTLKSNMYPDRCEGKLYDEGVFLISILELPYLKDQSNISALSSGNYMFIPHDGPHLKDTWECQNAPDGRFGICIHSANFTSELKGCMATGKYFGKMTNENGILENAIFHSAEALKMLKEYIGRDKNGKLLPFMLHIDRI